MRSLIRSDVTQRIILINCQECVKAMDKSWHPEHFQCVGCSVQFSGSLTYRESGEASCQMSDVTSHYPGGAAYCEQCYAERILPKCFGCHRPITDRALKALDAQWHVECFVCEVIVRSGLFLNLLRGCHPGQILHLSPHQICPMHRCFK